MSVIRVPLTDGVWVNIELMYHYKPDPLFQQLKAPKPPKPGAAGPKIRKYEAALRKHEAKVRERERKLTERNRKIVKRRREIKPGRVLDSMSGRIWFWSCNLRDRVTKDVVEISPSDDAKATVNVTEQDTNMTIDVSSGKIKINEVMTSRTLSKRELRLKLAKILYEQFKSRFKRCLSVRDLELVMETLLPRPRPSNKKISEVEDYRHKVNNLLLNSEPKLAKIFAQKLDELMTKMIEQHKKEHPKTNKRKENRDRVKLDSASKARRASSDHDRLSKNNKIQDLMLTNTA